MGKESGANKAFDEDVMESVEDVRNGVATLKLRASPRRFGAGGGPSNWKAASNDIRYYGIQEMESVEGSRNVVGEKCKGLVEAGCKGKGILVEEEEEDAPVDPYSRYRNRSCKRCGSNEYRSLILVVNQYIWSHVTCKHCFYDWKFI